MVSESKYFFEMTYNLLLKNFFSKIVADASTEYNNLENMDQWTKESLIGLSVIAAFCLTLGCLLIFVSKK